MIRFSRIATGLRSSESPISLGSMRLPIVNWIKPGTVTAATAAVVERSGLATTIGIGRRVAITEPMFGMKFNRNANSPNSSARSTFSRPSTSATSSPVVAERMPLAKR